MIEADSRSDRRPSRVPQAEAVSRPICSPVPDFFGELALGNSVAKDFVGNSKGDPGRPTMQKRTAWHQGSKSILL
jgi:hypothetical protein